MLKRKSIINILVDWFIGSPYTTSYKKDKKVKKYRSFGKEISDAREFIKTKSK